MPANKVFRKIVGISLYSLKLPENTASQSQSKFHIFQRDNLNEVSQGTLFILLSNKITSQRNELTVVET